MTRKLFRMLGPLLALLLVLLMFQGSALVSAQDDLLEDEFDQVPLEEVNDNPLAFGGQEVTVEGGIDEVLANGVFTIASDTFTDDDETLVVGANQEVIDTPVAENRRVWVTGVPVVFATTEVEEEFALDLDPDFFADWEGQPAILATDIRFVVIDEPFVDEAFLEGTVTGLPLDLPTVALRDEEGNVIGQADFTRTRRDRLLLKIDAAGIDPTRQLVAIAPDEVCDAEDFEVVVSQILDLSQYIFLAEPTSWVDEEFVEDGLADEALLDETETAFDEEFDREYFVVLPHFAAANLFRGEGSALVVHRGRSARSDIITCGVITEDLAAEGDSFEVGAEVLDEDEELID
ncbi:MAG: hypothetical protein M3220_18845 [Chloroflexota bacterium]|nr:hypothetical protein [Chloroflexota bacterium]